MFEREHHQKILAVLNNLNAGFLADCQAYFGGGTLVSLKHSEHRLSEDIDFLCSSEQEFRRLRRAVAEGSYNAIFARFDGIALPQLIKNDEYGIRFTVDVEDKPIKLEIVSEDRLQFGTPDYPSWSPVACLNQTDSFATKLLANTDRWSDRRKKSRDLIDLAVLRLTSPIPDETFAKTEKAFYPAVEHLKRAICNFQDNPDYREECYESLDINDPAAIIDGIDLLAADLGLEATERTFNEFDWEK